MKKDFHTNNLEDVAVTIAQIKAQKKQNRRTLIIKIFKWVFFPFTAVVFLLKYFFSVKKIRLTAKTTIIFTVIYGVLIGFYIAFVMLYIKDYLSRPDMDSQTFLTSFIIISICMGLAFLFIGAAAGTIISNALLRPIRKMIVEIDQINAQNLSARLNPLDSQDEIMELVDQINLMLDSLEESFNRQSNFVADASHELKTPLAVISGYADLLKRWGKNEKEVLDEGIDAIRRESAYMAKIIDQMLLLTKLGKLSINKQIVDINAAIKQVVDSYSLIYNDYTIKLFSGSDQILVECDKTLLIEAVRAIIDNAIKYTEKGGTIAVSIVEDIEEGVVKISIRDNGIGIDKEDLPYIFDRFYRCDKTRGREKGSAGLGLTICKNIIEMMDGKISVESKKGEGSEFTITLSSSAMH